MVGLSSSNVESWFIAFLKKDSFPLEKTDTNFLPKLWAKKQRVASEKAHNF